MIFGREEEEEDQPIVAGKAALLLDEEDEEDEPVAVRASEAIHSLSIISQEFIDAQTQLASNPWNLSAWMSFLDEVENGKGGSVNFPQAYEKFLERFPSASKFWLKLVNFYNSASDFHRAKECLFRGTRECWDVDIWVEYLDSVVDNFWLNSGNSQISGSVDTILFEFDSALERLGYSIFSLRLWRANIKFLKSFIAKYPTDTTKTQLLRQKLNRAISIPLEGSDELWQEYVAFENAQGDSDREYVIKEMETRFLHAKSILRDRKRVVSKITMDKIPNPPSNSRSDLTQLRYWSNWLRFEANLKDPVNEEDRKIIMRMVYRQCISCFFYHPEIWLSYSTFERFFCDDIISARLALEKAITAIPDCLYLKLALAELEEEFGNIEIAGTLYKKMYEDEKNPFAFAIYQRFVRRTLGISSARMLFSSTRDFRLHNTSIATEFFIAHAQFELEVNRSPEVAAKVLNLSTKLSPTTHNLAFTLLLVKVLDAVGDYDQVRWVFTNSINYYNSIDEKSKVSNDLNSKHQPAVLRHKESFEALQKLHEEYYKFESLRGSRNISLLNSLRQSIRDFKAPRAEKQGFLFYLKDDLLLEATVSLIDRYEGISTYLTPFEIELVSRMKKYCDLFYHEELSARNSEQMMEKCDKEYRATSADVQMSLSGIPSILKDFILKLPNHVGPLPDVDDFLNKFRGMELPPRPIIDERENADQDGFDLENSAEIDPTENEAAESEIRDNIAQNDSFRKRRRMW